MSSAENPFDYLAQLAAAIKAVGPTLPAAEDIKTSWSGVGFNILGHRMLAPLGEIVEILHVPGTTRLPGVQPWVTGLANVRGRLLPLFDIEEFFGSKLTGNKVKHRVLVLEMGELYAGLLVNEVYGLQHFDQDIEKIDVPEDAEKLSPYSDGAYELNGVKWTTFSPHNLVRDPRFFNAASG